MATDYKLMMQNLTQFYDFTGKETLAVGAGGGQFVELARRTKKLIAIDKGLIAIRQLETRVAAEGLQNQVDIVTADFCETSLHGDVVYFEFSLHEMDIPEIALRHALTLAPEVLVFDHLPGSTWAFHTLDENKVRRSSDALAQFHCLRHQAFRTEQHFQDYAQLLEKISCHGELAMQRTRRFMGSSKIIIPMTYGLTLVAGFPPSA
ncbi:MAG: class I SAM-dependent methyltransferase [Terriglobia bacterium]